MKYIRSKKITSIILALPIITFSINVQSSNNDDNSADKNFELSSKTEFGNKEVLGNGYIRTYSKFSHDKTPLSIGVEFNKDALEGLPTVLSDGNACYDIDNNGDIDRLTECLPNHEYVLDLPEKIREATAFDWVLINWNPRGHDPDGIYSLPHFDFHFYIQSKIERNFIVTGPCPGITNCNVYEKAIADVDPLYMPPAYINVKGVESRMGNHLADLASHEFHGKDFTHTFIYGSYDGHITYWEPMITKQFLENNSKTCVDIKLPTNYEVSGYYPTIYCMRYLEHSEKYYVSLENFIKR